jgi:hypothetical protein
MIFSMNGEVRKGGKTIARGIDGKFETKDEAVILHLKGLGFTELQTPKDEPKDEPRKLGRPRKTNTKEST